MTACAHPEMKLISKTRAGTRWLCLSCRDEVFVRKPLTRYRPGLMAARNRPFH